MSALLTEDFRLPAQQPNTVSVRALEWTNFFLADVQAGLGPFVAAYLASLGWRAGAVGSALTFGGIITVVLQTPAGAIVDRASHKRLILILGTLVLACGAILLAAGGHAANVYAAESLVGLAAPFLAPTIAAITMGVVGPKLFDLQFGRNQGFNAGGNLFAAAVIALVSHFLGNRAIFYTAAALTLPTVAAALFIRKGAINLDLARGSKPNDSQGGSTDTSVLRLARDRVLLTFLICAFLFHFANAAMLPQLGELLARGSARTAAPFMSGCVAITQLVILGTAAYFGRFAHHHGRKRLLLLGFGLLPVRAVLYTVFHAVPALLAVQILDGIANSIFGVVSILVIADRTRGSGRFNLARARSTRYCRRTRGCPQQHLRRHTHATLRLSRLFPCIGHRCWVGLPASFARHPRNRRPTNELGTTTCKHMSSQNLQTLPPKPSGTVSWIHIGDTHITRAGEQNDLDLGNIIDETNEVYGHKGIDFVFLPGDIADDGSATAYRVVRAHLDRLTVPRIAIVGDHDVHEGSFANFQTYVASEFYSAFTIGAYRFFRLNAFSEPRPDSFIVDTQQLDWLEQELQHCHTQNLQAVLLLHCYPSDLNGGGRRLSDLLRRYPILLVDMGHTHYNEISNDGTVLYSATRSTGQIEEGPVGYSVITLDEGVVSWHFVRLGSPALVAITHPADHRLVTTRTSVRTASPKTPVRTKIWSRHSIIAVNGELEGKALNLSSTDGMIWQGEIESSDLSHGTHRLVISAEDRAHRQFSSDIWLTSGPMPPSKHSAVDQENAIGAWTERDILGTQLGPNKNGRKW